MKLFNLDLTKQNIRQYTGRLQQIAGIERFEKKDGKEDGVCSYLIRTGAGLSFWVTPSKGMDIHHAELCGSAISWDSSNGAVHPAYYDRNSANWLKTASGGLLMTCGLTQVGKPGKDHLGDYGLHDEIHHIPAQNIQMKELWDEDECSFILSGQVEETTMLGIRLRLNREIKVQLGKNQIWLNDTIENIGFESSPLMNLYHFNFGFPLLNEETYLILPECKSIFSTGEPVKNKEYLLFQKPTPNFIEEVYYHTVTEKKDWVKVSIITPNFPIADTNRILETSVEWNTKTLPKLVQWKMPNQGDYVLGIEPSNCWTLGREAEKELIYLQPGESVHHQLHLSFKFKK